MLQQIIVFSEIDAVTLRPAKHTGDIRLHTHPAIPARELIREIRLIFCLKSAFFHRFPPQLRHRLQHALFRRGIFLFLRKNTTSGQPKNDRCEHDNRQELSDIFFYLHIRFCLPSKPKIQKRIVRAIHQIRNRQQQHHSHKAAL